MEMIDPPDIILLNLDRLPIWSVPGGPWSYVLLPDEGDLWSFECTCQWQGHVLMHSLTINNSDKVYSMGQCPACKANYWNVVLFDEWFKNIDNQIPINITTVDRTWSEGDPLSILDLKGIMGDIATEAAKVTFTAEGGIRPSGKTKKPADSPSPFSKS
jgi:hypothetical protein